MRKKQTHKRKWARRPERPNYNLQHKDLVCCNVYCHRPLTDYEWDRQTKSYKYRFCIKCRINNSKKNMPVAWNCLGCGVVLDATWGITGRYYCTTFGKQCEGVRRKRLEQSRISNLQKKLAREAVKQGGLQHYRSKISI